MRETIVKALINIDIKILLTVMPAARRCSGARLPSAKGGFGAIADEEGGARVP